MRKLSLLLGVFLFSIALIMGCSKNKEITATEESNAVKIATIYKSTELEINNYENVLEPKYVNQQYEKIRPLLTEKYYEKQYNNRNITLPLQVAKKEKSTLKPENIKFTFKKNEGDTISLDYSLILTLLSKEGQENKNIPIEGVITLSKINNEWRVEYDDFNIEKLRDLAYGK